MCARCARIHQTVAVSALRQPSLNSCEGPACAPALLRLLPTAPRAARRRSAPMAVTDAAPPPTLAPPTPLLGIVVEVSPNTTPSSSSQSYAKVVEAVVALRNAHLLCHHGGEVLVVAALPGATQFISSDQQNGGAATAKQLRECAERADSERKTPAAVAAALGRVLCYASRKTSTARCVLFKCGRTAPRGARGLDGCCFVTRKILVDAVSLGAKQSAGEARAHLAKGVSAPSPLRDRLVAVALATFGADAVPAVVATGLQKPTSTRRPLCHPDMDGARARRASRSTPGGPRAGPCTGALPGFGFGARLSGFHAHFSAAAAVPTREATGVAAMAAHCGASAARLAARR